MGIDESIQTLFQYNYGPRMIKLTDYITEYINKFPVNCVFGVQGGAMVHIFDSFHRTTDLPVCYTHHEQAAALAAVANKLITL